MKPFCKILIGEFNQYTDRIQGRPSRELPDVERKKKRSEHQEFLMILHDPYVLGLYSFFTGLTGHETRVGRILSYRTLWKRAVRFTIDPIFWVSHNESPRELTSRFPSYMSFLRQVEPVESPPNSLTEWCLRSEDNKDRQMLIISTKRMEYTLIIESSLSMFTIFDV